MSQGAKSTETTEKKLKRVIIGCEQRKTQGKVTFNLERDQNIGNHSFLKICWESTSSWGVSSKKNWNLKHKVYYSSPMLVRAPMQQTLNERKHNKSQQERAQITDVINHGEKPIDFFLLNKQNRIDSNESCFVVSVTCSYIFKAVFRLKPTAKYISFPQSDLKSWKYGYLFNNLNK